MTMMNEESSIYDDSNNFRTSCDTHPKQLRICCANADSEESIGVLKECPNFAYEGDDIKASEEIFIYCKHCWAIGFHSVCDNNPKGG